MNIELMEMLFPRDFAKIIERLGFEIMICTIL